VLAIAGQIACGLEPGNVPHCKQDDLRLKLPPLNKPLTEDARRSIRPVYHGLPAKLQHFRKSRQATMLLTRVCPENARSALGTRGKTAHYWSEPLIKEKFLIVRTVLDPKRQNSATTRDTLGI
jgi:hypothetical protein